MSQSANQNESTAFSSQQLEEFTVCCMQAVGASVEDASYMAYHLMASEIAGHPSHGLRRLPEYVGRALEGKTNPSAKTSVEKVSGALLALNGNRAPGHFALRDATALAVERAKEYGISAVTVRNSDFAGRFAPFCEQAAEAGVITLIFGNNNGSLQSVLPPGGLQPRLSTNPIAAGVPRAQAPHMVLDFATSAVASGRLHYEKDSGAKVSEQWVGAGGHLKPFGGFKGFGLALLVEALGGALSGSDTVSGRKSEEAQGTLIIAIDVAQLRDLNEYTAQVEEFIAYVKDTEMEAGQSAVRAPGENAPSAEQLAADNTILLNPVTTASLFQIAEQLKVDAPQVR
ncbi:Ldh family oxidoreductase [Glutamicibacter sp.]|uniref:Ldh family oxidoreductase n=1 Tax=Glutamicibacter sp. TaxID=1931995 RepID=UPI002B4730F2|nr:Ldh family oxidoreductase [Glutamicibacter sp.]HJX79334.1 Ldh family oxidoreductase [Glutamicibacter sp.]